MIETMKFNIGDKIKLIKDFYDGSPVETMVTQYGCPALPRGTTGKVVNIQYNHIVVEVINPIINKPTHIIVYSKDEPLTLRTNRIDCIERE